MTTRKNVRVVTDALALGKWIRIGGIREALPEPKPDQKALLSVVTEMHNRGELRRRGKRRAYEYRSGKPLVNKPTQKPKAAARLGFTALARLRESDPAAYQRAVTGKTR